jgi:predicted porin
VLGATGLACAWAAAGAAHAQSRVTIHGVLDANVEHVTNMSALNPRQSGFPGPAQGVTAMKSGGITGSQLGFSGTEDLGGGNQAVFMLESGIDLRNGALLQGGRGFGRQAYAGLNSARYGNLTLGRQYTSLFAAWTRFSPMAFATQYEPIIFLTGLNFRSDNTIKYAHAWGPVSLQAHWTFKSGVFGHAADEASQPFRRDSGHGAALSYADGPWGAMLAYDRTNPVMDSFGDKQHGKALKVMATGSYSTGALKFMAGYRWEQGKYSTGEVFLRDDIWWAGVNYQPTAQWTLMAGYYYLDLSTLKRSLAAETTNPRNPWQVSFIANYAVSKRTSLYVSTAYSRHAGLNFDLSPIGYANAYYLGAGKTSMTGVALGIRHRF